MAGIVACGSFVPRLRLGRGRMAEAMGWLNPGLAGLEGERSVCSWDEDSLTMAVEACRTALANAGSSSVERLGFASTTFPFADRSNATVVATALGLEGSLRTLDLGGSQRAGTGALAQALAECDAPAAGRALIVAADRRLARPGSAQEARYGHGAAACVVGAEDGIARLAGARHYAADFVDHYRAADGSFDYALEDRWVREAGWLELVPKAVTPLLAEAGVEAAAIDHLVVAAPHDQERLVGHVEDEETRGQGEEVGREAEEVGGQDFESAAKGLQVYGQEDLGQEGRRLHGR